MKEKNMSTLNRLMEDFIREPEEIAKLLDLEEEETRILSDIGQRYPICVTPYYLNLIDKTDPVDPIRKLCLPGKLEYDFGGHEDTSGEGENTVLPGMQHKYRQTALILSTNQCAMYCRHCFRKRMVGYSSDEIASHLGEMADYIKAHPEINNVLISGGDSFMNTNETIRNYLQVFCGIDSLDYIRFGTRTVVVLPERVYADEELLSILKEYNAQKQIYIVTHFNHPKEVTEESIRAVHALMDAGCILRNQTVLLRGVNDVPEILSGLWNRLTAIGVIPYYVFQCRPARGVLNEFQIPIPEGYKIVEQAKKELSGQAKSLHYVFSHVSGKIEILGTLPDGRMLMKYHQAKKEKNAGRLFGCFLKEDQCWVDWIPA